MKYLVSGLDESWEDPALLVEGEGPNRFAGWGGRGVEIRSDEGSIEDGRMLGVILYLAGEGGTSTIEVDGGGAVTNPDASIGAAVGGLTIGNMFRRNYSTTDHQLVFLGVRRGPLSGPERAAFWEGLPAP